MSESEFTAKYRKLIDEIGAELGYAHGWKVKAAARLGITPSHLSRVLHGRRGVGVAVLIRANLATQTSNTDCAWQCPGCLMYYAPHIGVCGCANLVSHDNETQGAEHG